MIIILLRNIEIDKNQNLSAYFGFHYRCIYYANFEAGGGGCELCIFFAFFAYCSFFCIIFFHIKNMTLLYIVL